MRNSIRNLLRSPYLLLLGNLCRANWNRVDDEITEDFQWIVVQVELFLQGGQCPSMNSILHHTPVFSLHHDLCWYIFHDSAVVFIISMPSYTEETQCPVQFLRKQCVFHVLKARPSFFWTFLSALRRGKTIYELTSHLIYCHQSFES